MGILCVGLYAFILEKDEALLLLATIGGAFVLGDYLRLKSRPVNDLAVKLFGKIMRREELKTFSGNSFYIAGLAVVVLLFPKPIVLLSVLYLAIGDPVAAVVGTLYGRHKLIGKKSLEGAAANWICTSLATALVASFYLHLPVPEVWTLALAGGTISMLVELIPFPADDNFTIPVFSAVLLTLVHSVFAIL
jgi:diacylglycerol kinase (CTP)